VYKRQRIADFFQNRVAQRDVTQTLNRERTDAPAVGPEDAPITLTLQGSSLRDGFVKMHTSILQAISQLPDDIGPVRITYRNAPFDIECNARVSAQVLEALRRDPSRRDEIEARLNPGACEIHRTAELVFDRGTEEQFIKFRDWMLDQGPLATPRAAYDFAGPLLNVTPGQVEEAAASPKYAQAILTDLDIPQRLNNPSQALYLNGRYVPPPCYVDQPEALAAIITRYARQGFNP